MRKSLNVFLPAILFVSMLAVPALADWKETGRDEWRVIYVNDEILPAGQGLFVIREKKEYIAEGPRHSHTPHEVVISYTVASETCKVQTYEMKALDEEGNVLSAQNGEEATPEFSLVPYCKVAQMKAARMAESMHAAPSTQFTEECRVPHHESESSVARVERMLHAIPVIECNVLWQMAHSGCRPLGDPTGTSCQHCPKDVQSEWSEASDLWHCGRQ